MNNKSISISYKRKADSAHVNDGEENVNSTKSNKRVARAAPAGATAAARYVYRDFSRVPPDEGETVLGAIVNSISNPSSIKHQKLPIKLDALLRDPELSEIIGWLPHGRAWRILKPKLFVKEVLTKYFDYCNYNSFVRLINAWGFRRLSSGPDRHAYFHELFLKGMPHLHSRMRRITGKDEKPPLDQEDEPDLYQISELFPVPPLQDSCKPSSLCATGCSTADMGSLESSQFQLQDHSLPSARAASASLLNLAEIADRRSGALLEMNVSTAPYNPFAAIAAQGGQVQQMRYPPQGLGHLGSGFTSVPPVAPFSFTLPSYGQGVGLAPQQVQQPHDFEFFSYMLQCIARGSASGTDCLRTNTTDATSEAPIMYIPVYPSTLARLGNGTTRASSLPGTNSVHGNHSPYFS